MDKVDKPKTESPKDKLKFDMVSILVVTGCVLFLFYSTLTTSSIGNAFVVGAMLVVFPLSFRIPILLLTKNRTRARNIELLALSFIYIIGLILIALLSPKWKAVFIFPIAFVLMTATTLIERVIKRLFSSNGKE